MKIAVYGANGYTGRLVAAELHRREADLVVVGRDEDRLRAAAPPGAEVRRAGLADEQALAAAFGGCDLVISCVAPFVTWGEPVVRAAITAGVGYLDISGEQAYIHRIFEEYGESAAQAGVTVVPMVNDGGFLADLITTLAAGNRGATSEITVAHRSSGGSGLSRGSGRSAMANLGSFTDGGLVYRDGAWRTGGQCSRRPRLSTRRTSSTPSRRSECAGRWKTTSVELGSPQGRASRAFHERAALVLPPGALSRESSAVRSSRNQTSRPRLDSWTKARSAELAASCAEMSPMIATRLW
jgi:short subunit dehydrogenase-like uncharacterized protein